MEPIGTELHIVTRIYFLDPVYGPIPGENLDLWKWR